MRFKNLMMILLPALVVAFDFLFLLGKAEDVLGCTATCFASLLAGLEAAEIDTCGETAATAVEYYDCAAACGFAVVVDEDSCIDFTYFNATSNGCATVSQMCATIASESAFPSADSNTTCIQNCLDLSDAELLFGELSAADIIVADSCASVNESLASFYGCLSTDCSLPVAASSCQAFTNMWFQEGSNVDVVCGFCAGFITTTFSPTHASTPTPTSGSTLGDGNTKVKNAILGVVIAIAAVALVSLIGMAIYRKAKGEDVMDGPGEFLSNVPAIKLLRG